MPYFAPLDEKDDESKNAGTVAISGASPTSDASGKMTTDTAPKGVQTGSGFQNVDSYLKVNQPQQFGQQFVGKLSNEVDQAKDSQAKASTQFQNQVSGANYIPTTDQVNSAIANPTAADAKQFQGWENNSYQGPHSLAESPDAYNQFWSGTQKANTSSQLAGSEPGRFTLLDSYYGRPGYNFGDKSLDNLLIQQGGVGQQTKNIQNQAAQLKSQGDAEAQTLAGDASTRAGQVEQSATGVRNAVGVDANGQVVTDPNATGYGALGQQYASAQNDLAAQNLARQNQVTQLQGDLSNHQLTSADLASLGLSGDQKLYGTDINQFFHGGSDLNINQTLTPDQRSKIQALSQLAGISDTFAAGTPQTASQAYSFDQAGLTDAVNKSQAAYNKAIQNAMGQVGYGGFGMTEAQAKAYAPLLQAINNQYNPDLTIGNTYSAKNNLRQVRR